jgi:hypothetical protein
MTTPLEKTIKRALKIKGRDYVVALSPERIKLTLKGHRAGVELQWIDLISGDAALATALQASLGKIPEDFTRVPINRKPPVIRSRKRTRTSPG